MGTYTRARTQTHTRKTYPSLRLNTHIREEDSFRVFTLGAEDESLDEAVEKVLQLGRVVGAVDDVAVILGVKLGLGTQLAAKVLARVCTQEQHGIYLH